MKPTTFTIEQRTLLQLLLKERLEYKMKFLNRDPSDKTGKKCFENSYIISALDKITNRDTAIYTSNEKLCFRSCINEHYEDFYKELQLPTALSWLTISDKQRKVIAKLDDCKDILIKSDFYKQRNRFEKVDLDFRYGNFLAAADKMKSADKIFLSKVGHNDFDRIAFVYNNKEYVPFELKHKVSWRDFLFISLGGTSSDEVGTKKFSLTTTKSKAKELLATCERQYYPDGVLDFMNVLLN